MCARQGESAVQRTGWQAYPQDIPGSKQVIIPDYGHAPNEERPAATLKRVMEFLGGEGGMNLYELSKVYIQIMNMESRLINAVVVVF